MNPIIKQSTQSRLYTTQLLCHLNVYGSTSRQSNVPVLHHSGSHQTEHLQDICGHSPVLCHRTSESPVKQARNNSREIRTVWRKRCNKNIFFFLGAGDKSRRWQPRRLWHLCEVWHQLSDGDGQRAAHATVEVPGATVWNHRRNLLHHWWEKCHLVQ